MMMSGGASASSSSASGGGGWPPPRAPPNAPPFAFASEPVVGQPNNPLHVSWHDQQWPASMINASNVLDYFANPFNPFYERTCSNETLKMQRLPLDQISKFVGIEFTLLFYLEPLYVIRRQKRHNPTQVTPIADYYIIGDMVYQAPDLGSFVNSRLLTAVNSVRSAFEEASSYMRYHPTKGYWWEFKGQQALKLAEKKENTEVRTTAFQRTRVDALLADLAQKFPPPHEHDIEPKPNLPADCKVAEERKSTPQQSSTSQDANIGEPKLKRMKTEST